MSLVGGMIPGLVVEKKVGDNVRARRSVVTGIAQ